MTWCFAIVDNRLAEIYFKGEGKKEILGHCYIDEKGYKTKQEKKWIKEDTVKYKFEYKKEKYTKIN